MIVLIGFQFTFYRDYVRASDFLKTKLTYLGKREYLHHGKTKYLYDYEYKDQYGNIYKTYSGSEEDSTYFNPINPNDTTNKSHLITIKNFFYVELFLILLFVILGWIEKYSKN